MFIGPSWGCLCLTSRVRDSPYRILQTRIPLPCRFLLLCADLHLLFKCHERSPDEPGEFPGYSHYRLVGMLSLAGLPELPRETVLRLHRDLHYLRVLTLSSPLEDEIYSCTVPVVPGRLDQDPPSPHPCSAVESQGARGAQDACRPPSGVDLRARA